MLPMSLDWIFLIALWFSLPVPNVTYVPGLNILDCPLVLSTSAQCYLCPWIEHSWLPFGSLYQCPMLPMSLDWIFLIALWFSLPVPNVTYVPGLNILDCPLVLSTSAQCYLCPWIEHSWLPFGSLPVPNVTYVFLIALWFSLPVSNVTYVPGLNILDCPLVLSTSAQCYLCPLIEYSWLPFGSLYQCPMLPMSLDWIFLIALWFSLPVPNVTYVPRLHFGSLYQCPMLPMSLDWTVLIALWFSLPVPNVTYVPVLNILDCPLVLSTSAQYYLCPWIEYSWLLFGSLYQCPMLPMSLDWIFLIALWFSLPVPNVTYVPGLNILDCPLVLSTSAQCYLCPCMNILDCPLVPSTSAQYYLCPWIEYSWLPLVPVNVLCPCIEHSWLPFGSLYQCPMLPMSLDWTFLIALWFSLPVPNVTYVPGLDCPLVLYQCPMLPMSLDWIFLIALWFSLPVPNVTYVPRLNILDCSLVLSTSAQCYLCPWIEYSWLPFGSLYQCPMLPMSLDWIFLIALWFSLPVPNVTYVPGLNILDCPLVLSTSAQC